MIDVSLKKIEDANVIPKKLLIGIRERDYCIEKWYNFQRLYKDNCCNILMGIYIGELLIGFLWLQVDPLRDVLSVNNLSVDKDYWFKTNALDKSIEFTKKLKDDLGFSSIQIITSKPKAFERKGFEETKDKLMKL